MPDEAKLGFEDALQQMEAIVKELENTEVPLEGALALFERGMVLSDVCRKQLIDAENRIEILTRAGAELLPEPYSAEK